MRFRMRAAAAVALFSFALAPLANAASMYFNPPSDAKDVGSNFQVQVLVSSPDQSVNAMSGTISYPTNLLDATSVSIAGSIISLWVQQPTIDKAAGTIKFQGIVLNPGFQGDHGLLFTINFHAHAPGTATTAFVTGSVLANDGKGTNVISGLSKGVYSLSIPVVAAPVPESTTPVETPGAPAAPQVSSSTHPDPRSWYANNVAKLSWTVAAGSTAVAYVIDRTPNTNPISAVAGLPSSLTTNPLSDGSWYFHVRLKNAVGWGGISHFRLQIDTSAPDAFRVQQIPNVNPNDPTASFRFTAHDGVSGVSHYEIRENGMEIDRWRDDGSHVYKTPPLDPGHHVLEFRAVDAAGNYAVSFAELEVSGLPAPVITDFPRTLRAGEPLIVQGKTFPNARVTLWVKLGDTGTPSSAEGQADVQGVFTVIYGHALGQGVYSAWVVATDERGAKSLPSDSVQIVVSPSAAVIITGFIVTMIILLALLILLGFLLWFIWRKLFWMAGLVLSSTRVSHEHIEHVREILRQDMDSKKLKEEIAWSEGSLEEELQRVEHDKMTGEVKKPKWMKKQEKGLKGAEGPAAEAKKGKKPAEEPKKK